MLQSFWPIFSPLTSSSSLFDRGRNNGFHIAPPDFAVHHCCFQVFLLQPNISRDYDWIRKFTPSLVLRVGFPQEKIRDDLLIGSATMASETDSSCLHERRNRGESVIDVGLGGMTLPRDVLHSHQKSCICSVQSLLEFLRECPCFGSIE